MNEYLKVIIEQNEKARKQRRTHFITYLVLGIFAVCTFMGDFNALLAGLGLGR